MCFVLRSPPAPTTSKPHSTREGATEIPRYRCSPHAQTPPTTSFGRESVRRSLTHRLVHNLAATLFSRSSSVVNRLAVVPVLLGCLGTELYGQWLIVSAIPAWLALSSFGIGSVAANSISMLAARGDLISARGVYSTTLVMLLILGIIGMAVSAGLLYLWGMGVTPFVSLDIPSAEAPAALLFLAASVFTGFLSEPFAARLRAADRASHGIAWNAALPWLDTACTVTAAVIRPGITSLALATLLSRLAFVVLLWFVTRHAHKDLFFSPSAVNFTQSLPLIGKGLAFQAFPLGHAFSNQGMILVVSAVLGPAAVVAFSTARTLARLGITVLDIINHSAMPELTTLIGAGNYARAALVHRTTAAFSLLGGAVSFLISLTAGPWLLHAWTLGKVSLSHALLGLFAASVLAHAFWLSNFVVPLAANRHEGLTLRFVTGALFSVLLCYPLSQSLGLAGAAISSVVLDSLMIVPCMRLALAVTHDTFPAFCEGLFPALRVPLVRLWAARSSHKIA